MRPKKIFKELMVDNKKEIEMDIKALEKIETRIDDKYSKKLTSASKN
jgi:hypothetical protein